jgi:glycosyltransferase involved in cell wall biosynthesis
MALLQISVLMPVYNCETYLRESIESILNQTFKDFEFLIIDDGSIDSSAEIIRSYSDPRIRLIQNEENIGITKSLNKGLNLAKGKYIARQDADDISMPERLEKQVNFLEAHSNIALISSSIQGIEESGKEVWIWKLPCDNNIIKENLLKGLNQFSHPSSMFKKECIQKVGGYRQIFDAAEDYDLWLRIAEEYEVSNIEQILCRYRVRKEAISVERKEEQILHHRNAHKYAIQRQIFGQDELGYKPDGEMFQYLRDAVQKDFWTRRRILSKQYLLCANKYAFTNGHRDIWLTLKLLFMSLLNNIFNRSTWKCIGEVFVNSIKHKLRDISK